VAKSTWTRRALSRRQAFDGSLQFAQRRRADIGALRIANRQRYHQAAEIRQAPITSIAGRQREFRVERQIAGGRRSGQRAIFANGRVAAGSVPWRERKLFELRTRNVIRKIA
jgi:hypothetical protein